MTWPVQIDGATCDAVLIDRVVSLARVELGGALVDAQAPEAACQVRLDCSGQAVVIVATLPGRAPETQIADLTNAAESVRPRVIALAIAEIVRDLERESEEPPPTKARTPAREQTREGARPVKQVSLRVFGAASNFDAARWLAGGGVGFDYDASHTFFVGSDIALVTRDDDSPLGDARTLLFYASPELGRQWTYGRITACLGLGFALGVARVDGHATSKRAQANTLNALFGAPFVGAGVGYAPSEHVRMELRAKAGWVALPVIADIAEAAPIRLEHLWVGFELGAAFF